MLSCAAAESVALVQAALATVCELVHDQPDRQSPDVERERLTEAKVTEVAAAVRGVLEKAARGRSSVMNPAREPSSRSLPPVKPIDRDQPHDDQMLLARELRAFVVAATARVLLP